MANNTINVVQTTADSTGFKTVQTVSPTLPDGVTRSITSSPSLGQGIVAGTIVAKTNSQLVHVCDFANKLKKDKSLKEFLIAQFQTIQDGIRAVLKYLGLSDLSGSLSDTSNYLKGLARDILAYEQKVIKPIQKFEKDVLGYVTWAQAMIAWITSLPARFFAVLQDCLLKIINAVQNVLVDVFADSGASSVGQLIQSAQQVALAITKTVVDVNVTVAGAKAIISAGQQTLSAASAAASTAGSSINSGINLLSQTITSTNISQLTAASALVAASLPSANTVASNNTQSNSDKKSTP
jgi:hypothetical protein